MESICVAVRVRPLNSREKLLIVEENNPTDHFSLLTCASFTAPVHNAPISSLRRVVETVDTNMLVFDPPPPCEQLSTSSSSMVKRKYKDVKFTFDHVLDENSTQLTVFEMTTRPLIDSVLDGFNATVFAYGATGCGKTHTISGTESDPGIIFLTMQDLYQRIEAMKENKVVELSVTFLEVYNETIRDLLRPEGEKAATLALREDLTLGVTVAGLSQHYPKNAEEVMNLLIIGNRNRTISPTEANAVSSRSHAVLQVNVRQRPRTASIHTDFTVATMSIIDLAGSERASANNVRGRGRDEGSNINRSLLALGNCINALCDAARKTHIPYRDSKLTRLLKFSLGGNCRTVMIVCISPTSQFYEETHNTLKYANRAKNIKTKLERNTVSVDTHVAKYGKLVEELKKEILELKKANLELKNSTSKNNDVKPKVSLLPTVNKRSLDTNKSTPSRAPDSSKRFVKLLETLAKQEVEMGRVDAALHLLGYFIEGNSEWERIFKKNSSSTAISAYLNMVKEADVLFKKRKITLSLEKETLRKDISEQERIVNQFFSNITVPNDKTWLEQLRESWKYRSEAEKYKEQTLYYERTLKYDENLKILAELEAENVSILRSSCDVLKTTGHEDSTRNLERLYMRSIELFTTSLQTLKRKAEQCGIKRTEKRELEESDREDANKRRRSSRLLQKPTGVKSAETTPRPLRTLKSSLKSTTTSSVSNKEITAKKKSVRLVTPDRAVNSNQSTTSRTLTFAEKASKVLENQGAAKKQTFLLPFATPPRTTSSATQNGVKTIPVSPLLLKSKVEFSAATKPTTINSGGIGGPIRAASIRRQSRQLSSPTANPLALGKARRLTVGVSTEEKPASSTGAARPFLKRSRPSIIQPVTTKLAALISNTTSLEAKPTSKPMPLKEISTNSPPVLTEVTEKGAFLKQRIAAMKARRMTMSDLTKPTWR